MKNEDITYFESYKEMAQNLLIQGQEIRAQLKIDSDQIGRMLRSNILFHLIRTGKLGDELNYHIHYDFSPSPYYRTFDVLFSIFDKNYHKFPGTERKFTLLNQTDSPEKVKDSLGCLKEMHILSKGFDWNKLETNMAEIRELVEKDEINHLKYSDLEISHQARFTDYLKDRIQQEGVSKDAIPYLYLCSLDSFCNCDDDTFFSGQTIVLLRTDWEKFEIHKNLRECIKESVKEPTHESKYYIRMNTNNPIFLTCKVGSYYPLSFEQLWDQMCIGMKLDKPVNPKQ